RRLVRDAIRAANGSMRSDDLDGVAGTRKRSRSRVGDGRAVCAGRVRCRDHSAVRIFNSVNLTGFRTAAVDWVVTPDCSWIAGIGISAAAGGIRILLVDFHTL